MAQFCNTHLVKTVLMINVVDPQDIFHQPLLTVTLGGKNQKQKPSSWSTKGMTRYAQALLFKTMFFIYAVAVI